MDKRCENVGRGVFVFGAGGICFSCRWIMPIPFVSFCGGKTLDICSFSDFLFCFVLFSLHVIPLTGSSSIMGVYKLHLGQVHKIASVEYCGLFNQSPILGHLDCFTFLGPSLQLCGPGVPCPWGAVRFQPSPLHPPQGSPFLRTFA